MEKSCIVQEFVSESESESEFANGNKPLQVNIVHLRVIRFAGSNPCANQSLCEHLCLMSPAGFKCVCKEGYQNNTQTHKCERKRIAILLTN